MTTEELTMMVGAILTSDDGSLMERIEYATAKIDAHIAEREAAQTRINQALIDGCNRMLKQGAQGTTADLEEYVALREAALVERIEDVCLTWQLRGQNGGMDRLIERIREAARRKE